ncbi:hypothetical protein EVAR_48655_1 [Eumeta japonica]|uniref:Uncharacterized protein n=1 Tax=Eumeta variegata TaxID=151549 RepID=A0A4C1XBK0_EUMVA|nr:hypothetical protein EVAR_48655_1 [Eumeta japonica]
MSCLYADDQITLAPRARALQEMVVKTNYPLKKKGMKVRYVSKTKAIDNLNQIRAHASYLREHVKLTVTVVIVAIRTEILGTPDSHWASVKGLKFQFLGLKKKIYGKRKVFFINGIIKT